MKFSILFCCLWICFCTFSSLHAQTTISTAELQKDFDILQKTLKNLHPGLYRYQDKATIESYFTNFQKQLQNDKTLPEAYLLFSQFVARLKCGHTYLNYWNQSKALKKAIFYTADKIPFAFQLVDRRMIVVKDATPSNQLPKGTEILSINGISIPTIIDSLLTIAKTDGSNIGSQLNQIQLSGTGDHEAFDIYFPLFFPPKNGRFKVKALNLNTQQNFEENLAAMSRAQRLEVIEARYGKQAESYDDLWEFEVLDKQTAYLKMGTFVTWKMELKWKKFLKNAFAKIKTQNIPNLIIDIRGNGGGMTNVVQVVAKNLLTKDITLEGTRSILAYEKVPEELNPYLSTWSNSFRDRTGKVKPIGDGQYTFKKRDVFSKTYKGNPKAYRGKTYLIVDSSNSSATFFMAKYFKNHGIATLVGQQTGGNRKGTNGGNLFFLNLPNTKIEIDIPLIADFPLTKQPDQGILPDIEVKPSIEDVINGVDTELETIRKLIGGKAQKNNPTMH